METYTRRHRVEPHCCYNRLTALNKHTETGRQTEFPAFLTVQNFNCR